MPQNKVSQAKKLRDKQYRDAHKERDQQYRDAHKEEKRAYQEAHKEERRVYMQQWRAANKERREEYRRAYLLLHPEVKQKSGRNYYVKVKSDPDKLEARHEYVRQRQQQPHVKARRNAYAKVRNQRPLVKENNRINAIAHYQRKSAEQRRALVAQRAAYHKQWREEHKDELKEYGHKYHAENREAFNEQARAYYHKNPLPFIQRARKRQGFLTGTYTAQDILALYELQRGKCAGCQKQLHDKYEIDHIMPLSLDPTGDRIENLQLLCMPCNRSKHVMTPEAWAKRIGKLFI